MLEDASLSSNVQDPLPENGGLLHDWYTPFEDTVMPKFMLAVRPMPMHTVPSGLRYNMTLPESPRYGTDVMSFKLAPVGKLLQAEFIVDTEVVFIGPSLATPRIKDAVSQELFITTIGE
jgi:hypothetical protein